MRRLALAILAIGIGVVSIPPIFGQPEKGVIQEKGAPNSHPSKAPAKDQQSADSKTIESILSVVTQTAAEQAKARDAEAAIQASDKNIQRKLANYTLGLLIVGFLQAVILAGTIYTISNQTRAYINGERSWVLAETGNIPDDFEPNPTYLAFLEIRPIITNYGKTPGRIVRIAIRAHQIAASATLPPKPQFEPNHIAEIDILLPPGNLHIQPARVQIPSSDFINIRMGDPVLYIYGFVEYTDFGNQKRKSNFCFVYMIPHGFTSLTRGYYTPGNVPKEYTRCT